MTIAGLIIAGLGALVAIVGINLLIVAARAAMRRAVVVGDTRDGAWKAYLGRVWGWGIVFTGSSLVWMILGVALVLLGMVLS